MITVFTSSFNYARHLRDAIESVLNQTYKEFVYHLIDYGSIDNTWDIINSYKDDRIRAIQMGCQVNKSVVMNRSITLSDNGYWSWCPADDYWHPFLLQRKVEYSLEYPNAVLYDDFWIVDENNKIIQEVSLPDRSQADLKREIWTSGVIGFTGIFIPTKILRGLPFPEDENISEDYQWMLQALLKGIEFIRVPEKLHYKRKHGGSVTGRGYNEVMANIKNIHKKVRGDT